MVAIFTYGFPSTAENFKKSKVELITLSNYEVLTDLALKKGFIQQEMLPILKKWREAPDKWGI
jgi:orotate phosphoribosyltransferase